MSLISSLDSINSSLPFWESVEYCATAIVAIAVVGEFLSEFRYFPKDERKREGFAKFSALILIAGLAIELVGLVRTSQLTGRVIANLNYEAGQSRRDSGEAIERAAKAEQNLGEANERAANAEKEAAKSNETAERERLARLNLEAQIAPRRLTPAQSAKLSDLLKPFGGSSLSVDVTAAAGLEGTNLADDIVVALNNVHIAQKGNQRLMDSFFGNVNLKAGSNRVKEANIIGDFLIESGFSPKPVQFEKSQDDDELRIRIGSKP